MEALHEHIARDGFRLRGTAMSRVDGFSDVVFGFALTLLVVSLEVPKTFVELHELLRDFLPFAISFFFLMLVWYQHFKFFRRYGLHDVVTLMLNSTLLFVVLFYVYPLKFLFNVVAGTHSHAVDAVPIFTKWSQVTELMLLFSFGFAAIYTLFGLMYWNAYRQRDGLALTPAERLLTGFYLFEQFAQAGIALLSCVVAVLLPAGYSGVAGWTYGLIGVVLPVSGYVSRKRLAALPQAAGERFADMAV